MGGGGGGKSTQSSGPSGFAKKITKEQWGIAKPIDQAVADFLQAAISGDFSKIPWLRNVVEGARAAGSRALTGTQEALARSGIGGTFARGVEAKQRQQGEFDINSLIAQVLQNIIGQTNAQGFGLMQGSPVAAGAAGIPRSSGQGGIGPVLGGFGQLIGAISPGGIPWP